MEKNKIHKEHVAFEAYANDWWELSEVKIDININSGRGEPYVSLTIEQAKEAIKIIKRAIKEANKKAGK